MKLNTRLISVAVMACLWTTCSSAYESAVHRTMSTEAFNRAYPDPQQLLEPLGINIGETFAGKTPYDWVVQGALDEDSIISLPPRSPRHFFNPTASPGGLVYGIWTFTAAPDWAFNTDGLNDTYSIPGAREALFNALTTKDEFKRPKFWADTFQAVGRVVHLIQDMAQPQHVRNDAHLTFGPSSDIVLRRFSRYERYADSQEEKGRLQYAGYPSVDLPGFRKFWKESTGTGLEGRGLAEFANRYFVTQNTIFKAPNEDGYFALPNVTETKKVKMTVVQPADYRENPILDPDGIPYTNVEIHYLSNNYIDAYNATYSGTNLRLATFSMLDFVSAAASGTNVYSMDNAVFDSMAQILVPRAVGYSAGLIKYFFRGKLHISPPAEGVYALIDHSQPDAYTKDTGGFTKVKMTLRNTTPGPDDQGQPTIDPMSSAGTLRAIVRFRRNVCYEPERLLGQPGAPRYGDGCKSAVEEVVVSNSVAPGPEINTESGQTVSFDFTGQDVIPINGTDLRLQVVYRGPLGEETDAVVVVTKDISEPSFYNFDNYSDCYRSVDGTYSTVAGTPLTASMSFNNGQTYNASVVNLPPGRYSRYAVLADHDRLPTREQSGFAYDFPTVMNQDVSGVTLTTPINRARPTFIPPGENLENYMYAYDGFGFYPAPTYAGAQACPTAVDPAPVPMNIVFH